jgi:hypothetical protein
VLEIRRPGQDGIIIGRKPAGSRRQVEVVKIKTSSAGFIQRSFFFTKIINIGRLLLRNLFFMILLINTVGQSDVEVGIKVEGKIVAQSQMIANRAQAEKLLPEIEKLLGKNKFKLQDIQEIEVNNSGGSFTSLRIGVATANALGFALGVPVKGTSGSAKKVGDISVVEPVYDREPDIGSSHNT